MTGMNWEGCGMTKSHTFKVGDSEENTNKSVSAIRYLLGISSFPITNH